MGFSSFSFVLFQQLCEIFRIGKLFRLALGQKKPNEQGALGNISFAGSRSPPQSRTAVLQQLGSRALERRGPDRRHRCRRHRLHRRRGFVVGATRR